LWNKDNKIGGFGKTGLEISKDGDGIKDSAFNHKPPAFIKILMK